MRRLLPDPTDPIDPIEAYAGWPDPPAGRPATRVNFVTSADGAAEWDGRSGPLGSAGDRAVFAALRATCDVVLVGAGTARAEGYGPVRLDAAAAAWRHAHGRAATPPGIAVVGTRIGLDPAAPFFTEAAARPVLVVPASTDTGPWRAVADVVVAGEERVDLGAALRALRERGATRVLAEGGPSVHGQLQAAGLVDELCLTVAPRLAGAGHSGIVAGPPRATLGTARLAHVLEEGGWLFLRYSNVD